MILEYIASDGEVMNALKKVNDIRTQIPLIQSLWLCNVLHELSTLVYSTNDTVVAKIIRTLVFSPAFHQRFLFEQGVWKQPVLHIRESGQQPAWGVTDIFIISI